MGTTSEEYQLLKEVGCVFPSRRQEKQKTAKQGIETQKSLVRTELESIGNLGASGSELKRQLNNDSNQCASDTWQGK